MPIVIIQAEFSIKIHDIEVFRGLVFPNYIAFYKDDIKGYSINDESLLEQFDSTYKDSEFIRGMKVGKNGFYSYSKTITEQQISEMSKQVEQKIIEAAENILHGNFPVNPKRIGDELIGCRYCKFRDVCYKTEKDIVSLEKIDSLDFLGGE